MGARQVIAYELTRQPFGETWIDGASRILAALAVAASGDPEHPAEQWAVTKSGVVVALVEVGQTHVYGDGSAGWLFRDNENPQRKWYDTHVFRLVSPVEPQEQAQDLPDPSTTGRSAPAETASLPDTPHTRWILREALDAWAEWHDELAADYEHEDRADEAIACRTLAAEARSLCDEIGSA